MIGGKMTSPSNWTERKGNYVLFVSESSDDKYKFDTYKARNILTDVIEMETSSLVAAIQFALNSTQAYEMLEEDGDIGSFHLDFDDPDDQGLPN